MARIGYARVSSVDQDLENQLAKLKGEGCEVIRSEKISGGSRDGRNELATVLEFLRPGDELVVTRLDRLGRDNGAAIYQNTAGFTNYSRASTVSSCGNKRSARPWLLHVLAAFTYKAWEIL